MNFDSFFKIVYYIGYIYIFIYLILLLYVCIYINIFPKKINNLQKTRTFYNDLKIFTWNPIFKKNMYIEYLTSNFFWK